MPNQSVSFIQSFSHSVIQSFLNRKFINNYKKTVKISNIFIKNQK